MKNTIRKMLLNERILLDSKEISQYESQLVNFLNYFNLQIFNFLDKKNSENKQRKIKIASYIPIRNEFNSNILMKLLNNKFDNIEFYMPICTNFKEKKMIFHKYNDNNDFLNYKFGQIPNFLDKYNIKYNKNYDKNKKLKENFFKEESVLNFLNENKPEYLDIVIVPLVGFDTYLNRLGYGGGFYDKFFKIPTYKSSIKMGFAYEIQKYSKIPINQYDEKLDLIITENGIYI